MSRPLHGRRAIVTGAAQGIGRAVALALVDAGATVSACDRKASIHDLAETDAPALFTTTADVSEPDQAKAFVDDSAARLGGIDIVVNNAGTIRPSHPLTATWEETVATFDSVAGDNYRGAYLIGRAAIPHVVAHGGGDIVNVVTDHVHTCGYPIPTDHTGAPGCSYAEAPRPPVGSARVDVYDSSKWAVKGLTLVWATALKAHGVRVNSFGMGATDTPMYRTMRGDRPVEAGTLKPAAVARVLIDLLTERSPGRTGDSVQLWIGHPCVLSPPGIDALALA